MNSSAGTVALVPTGVVTVTWTLETGCGGALRGYLGRRVDRVARGRGAAELDCARADEVRARKGHFDVPGRRSAIGAESTHRRGRLVGELVGRLCGARPTGLVTVMSTEPGEPGGDVTSIEVGDSIT